MKPKFIRIKYTSYKRLRKIYPALRGETMGSYFERLSKWLEGVVIEWDGYDDDEFHGKDPQLDEVLKWN